MDLAATELLSNDVDTLYVNGLAKSGGTPSGGQTGPAGFCLGGTEQKPLGNESLTEEEITALWSTQITLADNTTTYLGSWLADKIDSIIAAKLGL